MRKKVIQSQFFKMEDNVNQVIKTDCHKLDALGLGAFGSRYFRVQKSLLL